MQTNVQSTFTKQKRQIAKANELIGKIRAEEVREQRFDPEGVLEMETRTSYLVAPPAEIAAQVLAIIEDVVKQHGARQKANSTARGRFEFCGVEADLTVPQLRTLQDAAETLARLVEALPRQNMRRIPNGEFEGRPAFITPLEKHYQTKTETVPYEHTEVTRILTYERPVEILQNQTRTITIDYGLPIATVDELQSMLDDLKTAIQIAIDQANGQNRSEDETLNDVAKGILAAFATKIKDANAK